MLWDICLLVYNNNTQIFHFQAGDQIVRVDGLILSDSTHEEFLNLLRTKKSFTLSIKGKSALELNPSRDVCACDYTCYYHKT